MKKDILCKFCAHWVDCGEKGGEPWGFCVFRDLYTYTAYTRCGDYDRGEPMTEAEFEGC